MDLFDVYTAFAQTRLDEEESYLKKKEDDGSKLNHYEFGYIVKHERSNCYKI